MPPDQASSTTSAAPSAAFVSAVFMNAFTVGRSRSCDVSICTTRATRTVSSKHLQLFPSGVVVVNADSSTFSVPKRWMVQDLQTMNGTALNGELLQPGVAVELQHQDELRLAARMSQFVRILVYFPDSRRASIHLKVYAALNDLKHDQSEVENHLQQRPDDVASNASSSSMSQNASQVRKRPRSSERNEQTASASGNGLAYRSSHHHSHSHSHGHGHHHSTRSHHPLTKRLKRDGSDGEKALQCPVCYEYFHASVTLSCSHTFCGFCISRWFRTSLSCPQCRKPVQTLPVRNRALDEVVSQLVGDKESFRQLAKRWTQEDEQHLTMIRLDANLNVWKRWERDVSVRCHSYFNGLIGLRRVSACRRIQLTEETIERASPADLVVAIHNLMENVHVNSTSQVQERLRIFLFFA